MQTFEMELDKHRRIADFDCVGVCFADMQCINVTTKYPPQWQIAIRWA
jgi:hypothetical protein